MPEARDRRVTPLAATAMYAQRRASLFIRPDSDPFTFGSSPTTTIRPPPNAAGRGRALTPSRSVRPAWYPRTPLRELVRAIERRGVPVGERTPVLRVRQSAVSSVRLENRGEFSPSPVSVKIRSCSKEAKIVLEIAEDDDGDSEFLTPQKKLLESIDTVDKAVREEIQRLKRTPCGRRLEREKRVKTLMSMR